MSFYSVRTMSWQSKKFPSHPRAGVLWHVWHPCKALCPALALQMDRTTSAWPKQESCRIKSSMELQQSPVPHRHQHPGLNLLASGPWKSRGKNCAKLLGKGRGRWGISIKEGNSQLYKCSAVQQRLPYWLQDYCSSFWPPPKPDVTAQGTTLSSSVFLWTVIYNSQQLFFFP